MANTDRTEIVSALCSNDNRIMILLLLGTWLFLTVFLIGSTATADTEIDISNGVRVESIRIAAANTGEDAQIRLLIANEGQSALHFLGVSSAAAKGSRIDAQIAPGKRIEIETLMIAPNETLNLETFHQRLFLSGLKRSIAPGQELRVQLHFLEGDLSVAAHVH